MPFRNPITSLPASKITSGTFTGDYVNAGSFTLAGDPAHSHIQAAAGSLVFYAADGVTPLISMDTSSATGTITAAHIRTAATGNRIELGNSVNEIDFYTGLAAETAPGQLSITAADGITLTTPTMGPYGDAGLTIRNTDATHLPEVDVLGSLVVHGDIFSQNIYPNAIVDGNGNLYPRWAAATQRTFDGGSRSGTTNASGNLTVAHNLGVVPLAIVCSSTNSGLAAIQPQSATTTTFTVRALGSGGAALATTGITFNFVAVG